jgi:hypothetical protein
MGDISKNLSRHEFACECGCGFDTVDVELVEVLQDAADHFAFIDVIEVRIDITGPNRCVEHNEKVQKEYNPNYVPYSSKTQHMYARAADWKLFNRATGEQIDPDRVADYLEDKYPGKYGIGRYSNRTHTDTRTNGPARWGNS